MTFALTRVRAYGVESDEAVTKKFMQYLRLDITAANTNVALDLGTYAGTFWTAVTGSEPGDTALKVVKDIQTRAFQFIKEGGEWAEGLNKVGATHPAITTLDSAVSVGGAASETLTVTGLVTTDTILGVTQKTQGANAEALTEYGTVGTGTLAVKWTGNPGGGAVVRVLIRRAGVATVGSGEYSVTMDATNTHIPNILFATGSAPTVYSVFLWWDLKDQEYPIYIDKTA